MLPKSDLDAIVEVSEEMSRGDFEEEDAESEALRLADEAEAAKLAEGWPRSADAACFGAGAPAPAPEHMRDTKGSELINCFGAGAPAPAPPELQKLHLVLYAPRGAR